MRSIFRVGAGLQTPHPPPEISSLRYEISTSPQGGGENQRGLLFANIRCSVRRCMLRRRAVSETLWPQSS